MLLNRKLPPPDIAPLPELETDLLVNSNSPEPHGFVKPYARLVRERNSRVGVEEPLEPQDLKQDLVKRAPQTHASMPLPNVSRHIDTPLIGGSLPMPRCVHVPSDY